MFFTEAFKIPLSIELIMFALGDGSPGVVPAVRSRHSSGIGSRRISAGVPALPSSASSGEASKRTTPSYRKDQYEVPLIISRKFRDVKFKTLVGISSLASCSWYSVDDQLFLWPFSRGDSVITIQCDGVVTSVSIGVPSPFILTTSSKYMLVVCTENSVSLIGLNADLAQVSSGEYFLPLPQGGSTVFTQAGITATGRVLLFSASSTLVEVRYKSSATWFKSKCYYYYHSLSIGGSGVLSTVLSKVWGSVFPPRVVSPLASTAGSTSIYIRPENTFKYFASTDGMNLNLHAITPSPSGKEISLGSWRHGTDEDIDIRCIGRIALNDLISNNRIVDVYISVAVETDEPIVQVIVDSGELIFLRLDRVAGDLIIFKSHAISTGVAPSSSKKQRTSFGALPAYGTAPIDGSSASHNRSTIGIASSFLSTSGGLNVCALGPAGSTRVGISVFSIESEEEYMELEVGGSVISIISEGRIGTDSFGSFVLPTLSSSDGGIPSMPKIFVLTGKGVTVLDPICPSAATLIPSSVSDVVRVLSGTSESVFGYKAICIRAVSEDVSLSSIEVEQDFANREGKIKPLSGGVWIGGILKLTEAMLICLRNQPVLTRRRTGDVVVAAGEPVLASIAVQLKTLIKFIRIVLSGCRFSKGPPSSVSMSSAAHRRTFMHGSLTNRAEVARQQALLALDKLASDLSELDEVVSLLDIISASPITVRDYQGPLVVPEEGSQVVTGATLPVAVDLLGLVRMKSELTRLCEALITSYGDDSGGRIVEKLKTNCPIILCTVSPVVIRQFSPESIASIIHCAIANDAPVNLLLESVRALGRNNAQIDKSLSEVGLIIRSLPTPDGSDSVVEALLDGLQNRLNDEYIVTTVLGWCGTSLDQRLNDVVLDYLFSRGYTDHIHSVYGNPFLERYLSKRVGDDRRVAQVYANFLVHAGKPAIAGDVLEKLAVSTSGMGDYNIDDRIALLEMGNEIFSTSKRYMTLCIGKFVQLALRDRLANEGGRNHDSESAILESELVGIGELYKIASKHGYHDIQLVCFMFSSVDDKDLVKVWASLFFEDFSFWTRLGSGSIERGIIKFLKRLYSISVEVDSFSIWRRLEVVVAMAEYIHCLLALSGRVSHAKSVIAFEFLLDDMRQSVNQVAEVYSKVAREMSSWISAIPRNSEFGSDVIPSREYLGSYLADTIVSVVENALDDGKPIHEKKLLSVMMLLRNHIKGVHSGLESVISQFSGARGDMENRASLPNLE